MITRGLEIGLTSQISTRCQLKGFWMTAQRRQPTGCVLACLRHVDGFHLLNLWDRIATWKYLRRCLTVGQYMVLFRWCRVYIDNWGEEAMLDLKSCMIATFHVQLAGISYVVLDSDVSYY